MCVCPQRRHFVCVLMPPLRCLPVSSVLSTLRLRAMSTQAASAQLTPALLHDLTHFWLEDFPNHPLKEPMDMSRFKRWFMSSEENDKICKDRFGPAVEEAQAKTDQELLELATRDDAPNTALGLALLLDQIPRNIYRGAEARKVRDVFLCRHSHPSIHY